MDVLRVLSAPDLEVRKKTLSLALDLVTSRNIEEVSFFMPQIEGLFFIAWLHFSAEEIYCYTVSVSIYM